MFDVGVWMKGINGILEVVGGVLVLAVKKSAFISLILLITQQELIEDPHDIIVHWLRQSVENITTGSQMFGGIYLIAHGTINIFLAVQLLRRKLWAYTGAIIFLCLFIVYQIYRISLHHSALLTMVTCLDAIIVLLIRHEYITLKNKVNK